MVKSRQGDDFMSKKLMKQIILLVTVCTIIIWAITNYTTALSLLSNILTVISPIILGGAIAFIINIPLKLFEKMFDKLFSKRKLPFKLKRAISLTIAIIFTLGLVLAVIFVIVGVVGVATDFFRALPDYLTSLEVHITELTEHLKTLNITVPKFDIDTEKFLSAFDFLSKKSSIFFGNTISATTSLFSGIFTFFMGITFSIYLLLGKEKVGTRLKKSTYAFFSEKWADYILKITLRTERAFSNFITGQLTEAVILGTMCYLGMKILRLPESGLISIIVGFTALIPVFGAWIGGASGAFIILLTRPASAIIFLVFLILLQQVETNIIYPRVVGKSVGIPGILVLVSVSVGGKLAGMAGMLIAVPIVSVLYSIFVETVDYLYDKKKLKKESD